MLKLKLILVAAATSVAALAAEPHPLGLQLWSLRNQLLANLGTGMDEVRALGFTEVEAAGFYGHTAKQFRAAADAHGLHIVGAHFQYEQLQKDLPGVIADAKTLGASFIIVAWIPHEGDFTVDMARTAIANFNAWGAEIKKAGLSFGFHTHGYEFKPLPDGTSAFDIMLKETDPSLVFVEMDVFWVVSAGKDPVALLKQYPGRFRAFHVKDMRKGAVTGQYTGHAPVQDNVIVGQGVMDWPAILQAGDAQGIEYSFIEDETSDPVGNIPPSLAYLAPLGLKP